MAYCYFDGALLEESKASISIHNLGLQRGFGIFDLFRGRTKQMMFMEDHLDRFERSQQFLGLDSLITKDEIRDAVRGLQEWNGFSESTFRLMLLGDGDESNSTLKPLFFITNTDFSHYNKPESGHVITHEYLREYPEIKSINYLTSNHLHRRKHKASAVDVVYHKDGMVTEASRSNIFMVKEGRLLTPKDNILEGITRKHVLELAPSILQVQVMDVTLEQLMRADEVFITSTLKEVLPILQIDGKKVGEGRIGVYTQQIQEAFSNLLH